LVIGGESLAAVFNAAGVWSAIAVAAMRKTGIAGENGNGVVVLVRLEYRLGEGTGGES
jgi:hypothetical protein